jgi:hypothetical protein
MSFFETPLEPLTLTTCLVSNFKTAKGVFRPHGLFYIYLQHCSSIMK